MDKGAIAVENFKSGLNCCQAVVLAFKDELGLSEDVLKRFSIGFGGGLGRQRLTCGAVSGMCMVISALKSDGNDKLAIYPIIQSACAKFKEKTGSLICAELLSKQAQIQTESGETYSNEKKKASCAEMCRLAAEIAREYIK